MAFLLTFCISVIPLTIVELFPDVFPGVVNTAGFIALTGAALISVSLPLFRACPIIELGVMRFLMNHK